MKPYRPPSKTLNSAAENGDIESIMFHLLDGADINGCLASGHFALSGAVHYGHAQAVMYLLEQGANKNMRTALGWSPLFIAAWRKHLECAKVLLLAGASVKHRTYSDEYSPCPGEFTALHAAAYNGDRKMIRLLLKHGADPRTRAGGKLPEDVASDQRHKAVARVLRAKRRSMH